MYPLMSDTHTPGAEISANILLWYDASARSLPWRVSPQERAQGVKPNPYHVWLSEIMLQQTTIPHATRYFLDFVKRWPTVEDLASAPRDDIMNAWAGLGYYSRARNLYACAQEISAQGGFPETSAGLIKLPGIGPYTSGAIAAIAFDEQVAAVDGNVERVTTRLLAMDAPLPDIKKDIKAIVESWVPEDRPGDFAQAMMDLGATVCTPRSPDCLICPLSEPCRARALGRQIDFPVKPPKKTKPMRHGAVLLAIVRDGLVAERRADKGLLAGTLGLPTTAWREVPSEPVNASEDRYLGRVEHVFTHFRLYLDVYMSEAADALDLIVEGEEELIPLSELSSAGLPSVFRKALNLYQSPRGT